MNTPHADILKPIETYGSDTGLKLVYNVDGMKSVGLRCFVPDEHTQCCNVGKNSYCIGCRHS